MTQTCVKVFSDIQESFCYCVACVTIQGEVGVTACTLGQTFQSGISTVGDGNCEYNHARVQDLN